MEDGFEEVLAILVAAACFRYEIPLLPKEAIVECDGFTRDGCDARIIGGNAY